MLRRVHVLNLAVSEAAPYAFFEFCCTCGLNVTLLGAAPCACFEFSYTGGLRHIHVLDVALQGSVPYAFVKLAVLAKAAYFFLSVTPSLSFVEKAFGCYFIGGCAMCMFAI